MNENFDPVLFQKALDEAIEKIHEAFAMIGELPPSYENDLLDSIDMIQRTAQDVTKTYGRDEDDPEYGWMD
jgi:hypothetical protein